MRKRGRAPASSALNRALRRGPARTADLLASVIDGSFGRRRDDPVSVEQLADIYAMNLSERQRATFRDGVSLLLTAVDPPAADRSIDEQRRVGAVRLAEDIDLLGSTRYRLTVRLSTAVETLVADGRSTEAAAIVGLLAEHGPTKSPEEWAETYARLGSSSVFAAVCFSGVLPAGSKAALLWMEQNIAPALWRDLLAAYLPRMLREDPAGIAEIQAGALPAFRLRDDLYFHLTRYKLSQRHQTNVTATFALLDTSTAGEEIFLQYGPIDHSGASAATAADRWADADQTGLPPLLMDFLRKASNEDDDAAEEGTTVSGE